MGGNYPPGVHAGTPGAPWNEPDPADLLPMSCECGFTAETLEEMEEHEHPNDHFSRMEPEPEPSRTWDDVKEDPTPAEKERYGLEGPPETPPKTTTKMSNDKTISGWIVVDWKDETHRTRKSKPSASELGTNELLAKLAIDVSVPDVDVPTLAVDIDVPEPQVYAATLEALDDDELPDWSDVANEKVHAERLALKGAANAQEFGNVVDQVTARVLMEVNSRPDPANVREYVERVATETVQEESEGAVETEAGP